MTSVYSQHFSEERDVKRRRLALDEKAQILEMVKMGIYTPQMALKAIEKIDGHSTPPLDNEERSPLRSCHQQVQSPSCNHRSPSYDIEYLDNSSQATGDEI